MVLVENFKFFPSFHLGKLGLKLFVGVGFSFKISVLAKGKIDIGNNLRNYWFNLRAVLKLLAGFNRNSFKLSMVPSKTSKTLPRTKMCLPKL